MKRLLAVITGKWKILYLGCSWVYVVVAMVAEPAPGGGDRGHDSTVDLTDRILVAGDVTGSQWF